MNVIKPKSIIIICLSVVAVVLISIVIDNYRSPVATGMVKVDGDSLPETVKTTVCDAVADTFYLNFHSNMDSVSFYNELKANPSTSKGVNFGHGIVLGVSPKFNKEGCLDYVILTRDYLEIVDHQISLTYDPKRFDREERELRDVILNELGKVYGKAIVRHSKETFWEYTYSDKKVKFEVLEIITEREGKLGPQDIVIDSKTIKTPLGYHTITDDERKWMGKTRKFHGYMPTIYFYSKRYIKDCEQLDQREELEKNRVQHFEDSLQRTVGSRLK
jgi:hypothetical protein